MAQQNRGGAVHWGGLTGPHAVQLFVVGTGFIKEDEPEPSRGRLLLLQLTGNPGGPQELKALFEQTVNGCVYSVAPIRACPGKFVATVNSQVSVFEADPAAPRGDCLKLLCKTAGMILALYADVSGHTIVVGDLMRSVAVYAFDPDRHELTLVAKDYDSAPPAVPARCCMITVSPHGVLRWTTRVHARRRESTCHSAAPRALGDSGREAYAC